MLVGSLISPSPPVRPILVLQAISDGCDDKLGELGKLARSSFIGGAPALS